MIYFFLALFWNLHIAVYTEGTCVLSVEILCSHKDTSCPYFLPRDILYFLSENMYTNSRCVQQMVKIENIYNNKIFDKNIQFTIELQTNIALACFNVLVIRNLNGTIGHTVYKKLKHTNKYLNGEFHHLPYPTAHHLCKAKQARQALTAKGCPWSEQAASPHQLCQNINKPHSRETDSTYILYSCLSWNWANSWDQKVPLQCANYIVTVANHIPGLKKDKHWC